jgi:hypothetical protein
VAKFGDDAKRGIETVKGTTAKQVGDAAATTYRQGVWAGEYVSQNTAEQPLPALLIAGAFGYGIAYMIHGRK